jgi:hypothetical protein
LKLPTIRFIGFVMELDINNAPPPMKQIATDEMPASCF